VGALSAVVGYVKGRTWVLWSLGAILGAVPYFSQGAPWGYLWVQAGIVLLMPLPMALTVWLVIGAHDAMQELRPSQTCRRQ
jgi:hypothetical protein